MGVLDALELGIDLAGERVAVGVYRVGAVHGDERVEGGGVSLPAAGDDGVAALHEEAVTDVNVGVLGGVGVYGEARGAVEVGERDAVSPVHDVQHQPTAALGAVNGHHDGYVG